MHHPDQVVAGNGDRANAYEISDLIDALSFRKQ
jgi:hypothetical protein